MPDISNVATSRTSAFLHYFDLHFLTLKVDKNITKEVYREANLATRIAILYSDEILIPAASYFEAKLCRQIITNLGSIYERGAIWLVGSAINVDEFKFRKLTQYHEGSDQFQCYIAEYEDITPPFRTRYQSASSDLKVAWLEHLNLEEPFKTLTVGTKYTLPNQFERVWENVPDRLEEKAFVTAYVAPIIFGSNKHPTLINRLNFMINEAYFSSYVKEFQSHTVTDLIYLASPHLVPSVGERIRYRETVDVLRKEKLLSDVVNCNGKALLDIKNSDVWAKCNLTVRHSANYKREIFNLYSARSKVRSKIMHSFRAFIVHGHEEASKLQLKDYLQNTLGFPEPTILHQKPNMGFTVIEKFEKYANEIDVAFVLLTPDDTAESLSGEKTERARQNVIFELGFFVGRFGRKSGRVILLHMDNLEIPSDLSGVIYIDISDGIISAGERIRRELENITVDL